MAGLEFSLKRSSLDARVVDLKNPLDLGSGLQQTSIGASKGVSLLSTAGGLKLDEEQTREAGLEAVRALVNGFREHLHVLKSTSTSEAEIRSEYVDPFWSALGWDVTNSQHRSSAEKDVVVEAPVGTVEGSRIRSRRTDYLFRIDGFPRFFLEVKRPAVDISSDRDAIFQAKTYAWSAQIPFALLSDFEEFRLFDATLRPGLDEPERGVVADFDLRFEDYVDQWDAIWDTFSRSAVANGSLERLLAKIKKVRAGRRVRGADRLLLDLRGTEPVDKAFLRHLEQFRLRLAQDFYRDNRRDFSDDSEAARSARLAEASQRVLDRIVFIRVCEDRGIQKYGSLRETLNRASDEGSDLYTDVVTSFRHLDSHFNGYLFKPHFSETLKLSPDGLADFIRSLYPPEGPYRFEAIGDDLFGIIYERFLGSRLVFAGGEIFAEDKPEVRHAGGVYYTPNFVVDSIVRRTILRQTSGKTPEELLDFKILDPACGSGSFLIAAYQALIDYCVVEIQKDPSLAEIKKTKRSRTATRSIAFADEGGAMHLTPDFRSDLLLSCIYGVDIDQQAVEVTIMSLYLKMLEGELPLDWQEDWLRKRLLPPMSNNIRCGNSLLAPDEFEDYWDRDHGALFAGSADAKFRINAFAWDSETHGFGRIVGGEGGFNAIVGNPPYIRIQELNKWEPEECEFYKSHYRSASKGNFDIYVAFVERGLDLLASDGRLGFICPHKFWKARYGAELRSLLAEKSCIKSIVDFGCQQVFRGATTYTAIQVFSPGEQAEDLQYARVHELDDGIRQLRAIDSGREESGSTLLRVPAPNPKKWVFGTREVHDWMEAVASGTIRLGEFKSKIGQGIVSGADAVFFLHRDGDALVSKASGARVAVERELTFPLLKGSKDISRWAPVGCRLEVIFPYEETDSGWSLIPPSRMAADYPLCWKYLESVKSRLEEREGGKFRGDRFYQFSRPQNLSLMRSRKLLVPAIGQDAPYCVDLEGRYFYVGSGGGGGGAHGIPTESKFELGLLAGLLNSSILDIYHRLQAEEFSGGWYDYGKLSIEDLPIKIPESDREHELARQISEIALRVAKDATDLTTKTSDRHRSSLERQIDADQTRIDRLVTTYYGVDKPPEGWPLK